MADTYRNRDLERSDNSNFGWVIAIVVLALIVVGLFSWSVPSTPPVMRDTTSTSTPVKPVTPTPLETPKSPIAPAPPLTQTAPAPVPLPTP
jgi:type IV secretory pathway VirB10-like protein